MSRTTPMPIGASLVLADPCPFGTHQIKPWQTNHAMGPADVAFLAGLSCNHCKKTWDTIREGFGLVPPEPTWADPSWPASVKVPLGMVA